MTSTETPYQDNPEDAESAPLLPDGHEATATHGETTATMDEEQGTAVPRPGEEGSTAAPRRKFNFIIFHRITLILAVLVLSGALGFGILEAVAGRQLGYQIPHDFERGADIVLPSSFITIAFAGVSLYRHRKKRTPLPTVVGTAVHGLLGFFIFEGAGMSSDGVNHSPTSRCWGWHGGSGGYNSCVQFARVFWWFLLTYVVVLFVLSFLQYVLFIACLVVTYRSRTWSRGSEHGLTFPGGHVSIEFSVRFVRQDAPPPAPIQGVSPTSTPSPPPIAAAAAASTAPPRPAQLISTD